MWLIFDQKCGLKWLIFVPPNCKQYWLFLTYFFNLKKFSEKFFACGSYFHRYTVKSKHCLAVVFIKYTVDWRKNNFPATVACTKLKKTFNLHFDKRGSILLPQAGSTKTAGNKKEMGEEWKKRCTFMSYRMGKLSLLRWYILWPQLNISLPSM